MVLKYLTDWENELPDSILGNQKKLAERRAFLMKVTSISAAALLPGFTLAQSQRTKTTKSNNTVVSFLQQQPWKTFARVQEHLFPATIDSPGANDINATEYLKNTLDTPDMESEDRKFILNGINWLDGISKDLNDKPFLQLQEQKREIVLRRIAKSRAGENWLATLLLYIFEALLTDPVYGGNPGGIGWKWLQHKPGFPLPPEDKKYFKLLKL